MTCFVTCTSIRRTKWKPKAFCLLWVLSFKNTHSSQLKLNNSPCDILLFFLQLTDNLCPELKQKFRQLKSEVPSYVQTQQGAFCPKMSSIHGTHCNPNIVSWVIFITNDTGITLTQPSKCVGSHHEIPSKKVYPCHIYEGALLKHLKLNYVM